MASACSPHWDITAMWFSILPPEVRLALRPAHTKVFIGFSDVDGCDLLSSPGALLLLPLSPAHPLRPEQSNTMWLLEGAAGPCSSCSDSSPSCSSLSDSVLGGIRLTLHSTSLPSRPPSAPSRSNKDDGEDRRGEGEKGGLASGVQVREKLTGLRLLKKK